MKKYKKLLAGLVVCTTFLGSANANPRIIGGKCVIVLGQDTETGAFRTLELPLLFCTRAEIGEE